ncbi:MAG TPA: PD-(D/E)XK nuclease family protein [Bryobacteraceae bacterium]|nr:PD-(D/E)XK nuclease family protein [Bryobacteraceae bacterium]
MLLILGPPGSGKTTYSLSRLREALRSNLDTCRLIVPTATMAEHLRNELAREGFVMKPALVTTFTKFLEPYCSATPGVGSGGVEIILSEVLERLSLSRYAAVRDLPGFVASVTQVVQEFSSAGGFIDDLKQTGVEPDFIRIYEDVLQLLKERNLHLRGSQLRHAAEKIASEGCPGVEELIFTGFYSFTAPELAVIRELAKRLKLTVTVAEWPGAAPTIEALSAIASDVKKLDPAPPCLNRTLCVAPTLDAEVSEIARRIVQAHGNGRSWREMGVLLRSEAIYVPALRSAFARFGIPSRFYFSDRLADAPATRYIRGILDALHSGWDHLTTLRALRLPGSPFESGTAGDRFEHDVLKRAPGVGIERLRQFDDETVQSLLTDLDALTPWMTGKAYPRTWADRMRRMRTFFAPVDLQDRCSHETALLWRSQAAALDGFEAACDAAATVLDPAVPLDCKRFCRVLETILSSSELRVPDHRRDVVHVIDAFEARQWSIPIVFICGLLEKEFPKYQSEDAIIPDSVRRRLQTKGVQLRTSVQRQSDERFLFDLALTRAREGIVLSYPQLNAKGEANLPSFFLQHARPFIEDRAADVRPVPARERAMEPLPFIATEEARDELDRKHRHFSPTGVETYLQCPYQFFAQKTLKLSKTPEQPWERLNGLVQGEIVHRVLERSHRERRRISDIFDEIFDEKCAAANVPAGYRTEAIRLELLHNLEVMEADSRLARGVTSRYEEPFAFDLENGAVLKGTIDRIEIDAQGNATVIDYKYKSKQGTEKVKKGHEEKTGVQGGLYLLAAKDKGFRPAGMVYCGLKRDVTFAGWMLAPHYPEIRQSCDPETLTSVMNQSRENALDAIAGMRDGRIEPKPADETRCKFCDIADACRYEVAAMEQAEKAGR